MKYTCQPTGNRLDELGIPKIPYFDPSHDSIASFSRFLEGGHSIPPLPPFRTAQFCIPSDYKALNISYGFEFSWNGSALIENKKRKIKTLKNLLDY